MLEDLVTAAVNEGLLKSKELANARMGAVTGALGNFIPSRSAHAAAVVRDGYFTHAVFKFDIDKNLPLGDFVFVLFYDRVLGVVNEDE